MSDLYPEPRESGKATGASASATPRAGSTAEPTARAKTSTTSRASSSAAKTPTVGSKSSLGSIVRSGLGAASSLFGGTKRSGDDVSPKPASPKGKRSRTRQARPKTAGSTTPEVQKRPRPDPTRSLDTTASQTSPDFSESDSPVEGTSREQLTNSVGAEVKQERTMNETTESPLQPEASLGQPDLDNQADSEVADNGGEETTSEVRDGIGDDGEGNAQLQRVSNGEPTENSNEDADEDQTGFALSPKTSKKVSFDNNSPSTVLFTPDDTEHARQGDDESHLSSDDGEHSDTEPAEGTSSAHPGQPVQANDNFEQLLAMIRERTDVSTDELNENRGSVDANSHLAQFLRDLEQRRNTRYSKESDVSDDEGQIADSHDHHAHLAAGAIEARKSTFNETIEQFLGYLQAVAEDHKAHQEAMQILDEVGNTANDTASEAASDGGDSAWSESDSQPSADPQSPASETDSTSELGSIETDVDSGLATSPRSPMSPVELQRDPPPSGFPPDNPQESGPADHQVSESDREPDQNIEQSRESPTKEYKGTTVEGGAQNQTSEGSARDVLDPSRLPTWSTDEDTSQNHEQDLDQRVTNSTELHSTPNDGGNLQDHASQGAEKNVTNNIKTLNDASERSPEGESQQITSDAASLAENTAERTDALDTADDVNDIQPDTAAEQGDAVDEDVSSVEHASSSETIKADDDDDEHTRNAGTDKTYESEQSDSDPQQQADTSVNDDLQGQEATGANAEETVTNREETVASPEETGSHLGAEETETSMPDAGNTRFTDINENEALRAERLGDEEGAITANDDTTSSPSGPIPDNLVGEGAIYVPENAKEPSSNNDETRLGGENAPLDNSAKPTASPPEEGSAEPRSSSSDQRTLRGMLTSSLSGPPALDVSSSQSDPVLQSRSGSRHENDSLLSVPISEVKARSPGQVGSLELVTKSPGEVSQEVSEAPSESEMLPQQHEPAQSLASIADALLREGSDDDEVAAQMSAIHTAESAVGAANSLAAISGQLLTDRSPAEPAELAVEDEAENEQVINAIDISSMEDGKPHQITETEKGQSSNESTQSPTPSGEESPSDTVKGDTRATLEEAEEISEALEIEGDTDKGSTTRDEKVYPDDTDNEETPFGSAAIEPSAIAKITKESSEDDAPHIGVQTSSLLEYGDYPYPQPSVPEGQPERYETNDEAKNKDGVSSTEQESGILEDTSNALTEAKEVSETEVHDESMLESTDAPREETEGPAAKTENKNDSNAADIFGESLPQVASGSENTDVSNLDVTAKEYMRNEQVMAGTRNAEEMEEDESANPDETNGSIKNSGSISNTENTPVSQVQTADVSKGADEIAETGVQQESTPESTDTPEETEGDAATAESENNSDAKNAPDESVPRVTPGIEQTDESNLDVAAEEYTRNEELMAGTRQPDEREGESLKSDGTNGGMKTSDETFKTNDAPYDQSDIANAMTEATEVSVTQTQRQSTPESAEVPHTETEGDAATAEYTNSDAKNRFIESSPEMTPDSENTDTSTSGVEAKKHTGNEDIAVESRQAEEIEAEEILRLEHAKIREDEASDARSTVSDSTDVSELRSDLSEYATGSERDPQEDRKQVGSAADDFDGTTDPGSNEMTEDPLQSATHNAKELARGIIAMASGILQRSSSSMSKIASRGSAVLLSVQSSTHETEEIIASSRENDRTDSGTPSEKVIADAMYEEIHKNVLKSNISMDELKKMYGMEIKNIIQTAQSEVIQQAKSFVEDMVRTSNLKLNEKKLHEDETKKKNEEETSDDIVKKIDSSKSSSNVSPNLHPNSQSDEELDQQNDKKSVKSNVEITPPSLASLGNLENISKSILDDPDLVDVPSPQNIASIAVAITKGILKTASQIAEDEELSARRSRIRASITRFKERDQPDDQPKMSDTEDDPDNLAQETELPADNQDAFESPPAETAQNEDEPTDVDADTDQEPPPKADDGEQPPEPDDAEVPLDEGGETEPQDSEAPAEQDENAETEDTGLPVEDAEPPKTDGSAAVVATEDEDDVAPVPIPEQTAADEAADEDDAAEDFTEETPTESEPMPDMDEPPPTESQETPDMAQDDLNAEDKEVAEDREATVDEQSAEPNIVSEENESPGSSEETAFSGSNDESVDAVDEGLDTLDATRIKYELGEIADQTQNVVSMDPITAEMLAAEPEEGAVQVETDVAGETPPEEDQVKSLSMDPITAEMLEAEPEEGAVQVETDVAGETPPEEDQEETAEPDQVEADADEAEEQMYEGDSTGEEEEEGFDYLDDPLESDLKVGDDAPTTDSQIPPSGATITVSVTNHDMTDEDPSIQDIDHKPSGIDRIMPPAPLMRASLHQQQDIVAPMMLEMKESGASNEEIELFAKETAESLKGKEPPFDVDSITFNKVGIDDILNDTGEDAEDTGGTSEETDTSGTTTTSSESSQDTLKVEDSKGHAEGNVFDWLRRVSTQMDQMGITDKLKEKYGEEPERDIFFDNPRDSGPTIITSSPTTKLAFSDTGMYHDQSLSMDEAFRIRQSSTQTEFDSEEWLNAQQAGRVQRPGAARPRTPAHKTPCGCCPCCIAMKHVVSGRQPAPQENVGDDLTPLTSSQRKIKQRRKWTTSPARSVGDLLDGSSVTGTSVASSDNADNYQQRMRNPKKWLKAATDEFMRRECIRQVILKNDTVSDGCTRTKVTRISRHTNSLTDCLASCGGSERVSVGQSLQMQISRGETIINGKPVNYQDVKIRTPRSCQDARSVKSAKSTSSRRKSSRCRSQASKAETKNGGPAKRFIDTYLADSECAKSTTSRKRSSKESKCRKQITITTDCSKY